MANFGIYEYLLRLPRNVYQLIYDTAYTNDDLLGVNRFISIYQPTLMDKFDYSKVKTDPLEIRLYYEGLDILASIINLYTAGVQAFPPFGQGWWTHTAPYITPDQLTMINNMIKLDSILSR